MNFLIIIGLVALLCPSFSLSLPRKSTKGQEPIEQIEYECPWDGVFAYEESCDKFVECWNNVAILWQCTELMLFDLTYLGCNHAAYVHCEDRPRPTNVPSTANPTSPTTTSNVTTSTTERPSEEFDCPSDGVHAHPEKCEYYWECYAGDAKLVHCQIDFLFDLVFMGCNYPEYTHCQDRERPPGVKPTLNPSPGTTTKTTTTEAPETEPTLNTGPTTQYTGPSTTSTTTTTEEPKEEVDCPVGSEGDLIADPEKCNCYYACSGGTPIPNCCPAGLLFDPETGLCDYPNNVDCRDRPNN